MAATHLFPALPVPTIQEVFRHTPGPVARGLIRPCQPAEPIVIVGPGHIQACRAPGGREALSIHIELYGIPRQRAGTADTWVAGHVSQVSLGQVLGELAARFPGLAETCIDQGCLRDGYIVSIGGDRFVSDPQTPVRPGDTLLLMSTDAGG